MTTESPDNLNANLHQDSSGKSRSNFLDPLPWVMLTVAVVLDQLTKWQVIENLAVGESWPETGFFRFTHAWNTGTAFSLFQGQGDILTWVSLGAVGVLSCIYRSVDRPSLVLRVAFGMQFGGAIGNIADRIRLGHVTDFIDVGVWPVFNIADSSIVIGIGLMIYYFWFVDNGKQEKDVETQPVSPASGETTDSDVVSASLDSPE